MVSVNVKHARLNKIDGKNYLFATFGCDCGKTHSLAVTETHGLGLLGLDKTDVTLESATKSVSIKHAYKKDGKAFLPFWCSHSQSVIPIEILGLPKIIIITYPRFEDRIPLPEEVF